MNMPDQDQGTDSPGRLRRAAHFSFMARRPEIARLVATVDSDPGKWTRDTESVLSNSYRMILYFSPALSALNGRAQPIEKCIAHNALLPHGDKLNRKQFSSAISGGAVTLLQLAKVDQALRAIANHSSPAVLEFTQVTAPAPGMKAPQFVLPENSVVPSLYWVEQKTVKAFREHFGLSREKLGWLCFGNHPHASSVFRYFEDGFEEIGGVKHGYRVTKYMALYMNECFKAVFAMFAHYHKAAFAEMPGFAQFFDDSHTAGLARCTVALNLGWGNMCAAASEADLNAMRQRMAQASGHAASAQPR